MQDFKVVGHSGEFSNFINRRKVCLPNSSQLGFETGLRGYNDSNRNTRHKDKLKRPFETNTFTSRDNPPVFVMTKKDFDLKKKNLMNLDERNFKEFIGFTGKKEVRYPAQ